MSRTDQTGKPGRRNRKKEPKNPKPEQKISPQPEPVEQASAPIEATVAPPAPAPIDAAASADAGPIADEPVDTAPIGGEPVDTAPIGGDAPVDAAPVSFQTIANAYGDFTRKSLQETKSFLEELAGVRSLDKAMELQTEFARQAYQTFVAEAQKIRGLHGEMVKQAMKPLEDLVHKTGRDIE